MKLTTTFSHRLLEKIDQIRSYLEKGNEKLSSVVLIFGLLNQPSPFKIPFKILHLQNNFCAKQRLIVNLGTL